MTARISPDTWSSAAVTRVDADDVDDRPLRERWLDGECLCSCGVRRDADTGALVSDGVCTCTRLARVVDRGNGPRLIQEPCARPAEPAERTDHRKETNMTIKTSENTTDADRALAVAKKRQQKWSAEAWKTTDAQPIVESARTDAEDDQRADEDPIARAKRRQEAWSRSAHTAPNAWRT